MKYCFLLKLFKILKMVMIWCNFKCNIFYSKIVQIQSLPH